MKTLSFLQFEIKKRIRNSMLMHVEEQLVEFYIDLIKYLMAFYSTVIVTSYCCVSFLLGIDLH